jgi:UDP-glucuronate 4-epimerase
MKILVTGAAGFIGAKLVRRLAGGGNEIVGLDNISSYYDVQLKYGRLDALTGISKPEIKVNKLVRSKQYANYQFVQMDIEDNSSIQSFFKAHKFDRVCHLAAQAGVRYSIENPHVYAHTNVSGFLNILEACRQNEVRHLVYASSSSVYGLSARTPFSEKDPIAHPVSLYAATKKSNELMAHAYSHLYNLPVTGLRFFTVYGPWGRPDMAPFLFTDAIMHGRSVKLFNDGNMLRDFTFIDDVVEATARIIDTPAQPNPQWDASRLEQHSSSAPYRIYNVGNARPVALMDFIHALEEATGKKAQKEFLPMQNGDVYQTCADTSLLQKTFDFKPVTDVSEGVRLFVDWYKSFYSA